MTTDLVSELADRYAITEALNRYSRALDRMDREQALAVFHPSAKFVYAQKSIESPSALVDWIWSVHEKLTWHAHCNSNVLIDLVDTHARSEAYVQAFLARSRGTDLVALRCIHGRYLDQWDRVEGNWVIVHREYVHEFEERREVKNLASASNPTARRDIHDPSYALLGPEFRGMQRSSAARGKS